MSTPGVFAVARSVFDHTVFAVEPYTEVQAWLWMLGEASWKPRRIRIGSTAIDLERGQMAFSTRFVAAKWQWSEARVRRFFKRLISAQMIVADTDAHATRITVCNYDDYQKVAMPSDADATQTRRTSDAQATHQRRKTEDREYRESIEDTSSLRSEEREDAPADDVRAAFDAYNRTAPSAGWPIARSLDARRRASLKARLSECGGLPGWEDVLERARGSPLLTGKNGRGWKADLDFLLKPRSLTRLMEGSYDAGATGSPRQSGPQRDEQPTRLGTMLAGMADALGVEAGGARRASSPPSWDDGPVIDAEAGFAGGCRELSPLSGAGGSARVGAGHSATVHGFPRRASFAG